MKTHAPAAVFPAVVDSESPQTHKEKERGRESPSPSALTHTHMCNNTTATQCTEVNKVHAYNFLVIGQCPLIILINRCANLFNLGQFLGSLTEFLDANEDLVTSSLRDTLQKQK